MENNKNYEWQHDAVRLDETGVLSRREIAKLLKVPRSTCLDFLREYQKFKNLLEPKEEVVRQKRYDNSRILFISDAHIPYHHQDMLGFLEMLKKRYDPTRVICIGDELDHHSISFHDSDQDLFSAGHELQEALKVVKELHSMFPEMDIVDSNHGSLVYRKAKHHGIPRHCIKSYNEILGVDDGWQWHQDITLELPNGESVYVHHGKSANGLQLSQTMGMSCVQGHFHEKFNVAYWANSLGLYFSMQIGCLIDDESYAFAYNNVNLKRPIIGTGLIIDGYPVLEAMPL